ncbi:hypothetical protein JTB14_020138 [Gonioctena quinquepunctata]|nr:hypothetical protein JTB14_020138 [Gonioctena quinquepunctata]
MSVHDLYDVSETWFGPNISNEEISLMGYNLLRVDMREKRGGGVGIYFRQNLKCYIITAIDSTYIEQLWVCIYILDIERVVGVFYRLTDTPAIQFLNELDSSLNIVATEFDFTVCAGDMNIDLVEGYERIIDEQTRTHLDTFDILPGQQAHSIAVPKLY